MDSSFFQLVVEIVALVARIVRPESDPVFDRQLRDDIEKVLHQQKDVFFYELSTFKEGLKYLSINYSPSETSMVFIYTGNDADEISRFFNNAIGSIVNPGKNSGINPQTIPELKLIAEQIAWQIKNEYRGVMPSDPGVLARLLTAKVVTLLPEMSGEIKNTDKRPPASAMTSLELLQKRKKPNPEPLETIQTPVEFKRKPVKPDLRLIKSTQAPAEIAQESVRPRPKLEAVPALPEFTQSSLIANDRTQETLKIPSRSDKKLEPVEITVEPVRESAEILEESSEQTQLTAQPNEDENPGKIAIKAVLAWTLLWLVIYLIIYDRFF